MANEDEKKEPGKTRDESHPVGVGIGAAGGAATGAALGAAGGPVGAVIGAAVGGIAGGLAGRSVARAIDPEAEEAYWRENYASRPYVDRGRQYDAYAPAYRHGWESYGRYPGRVFEDVEPDLRRSWEKGEAGASMEWDRAKDAVRDAWHRVKRSADDTLDSSEEDRYWRESYASRPYVAPGEAYEIYAAAYRYGWQSYDAYGSRPFEEVEPELARGWERQRGIISLTWDRAREAVRDAWHRLERAVPGDADRDGR